MLNISIIILSRFDGPCVILDEVIRVLLLVGMPSQWSARRKSASREASLPRAVGAAQRRASSARVGGGVVLDSLHHAR